MNTRTNLAAALLAAVALTAALPGCGHEAGEETFMGADEEPSAGTVTQTATLAAGCFWCVEAVFQSLEGVLSVESGYTGGRNANPTYEQICTGMTGHAEAIRIRFDPKAITFSELLEVFWKTHDPTTLNRQGADVGTQYRSAVFSHDEEQKRQAEALKHDLNEAGAFAAPIVTEVVSAGAFYPAEDYHQDYYRLHGTEPYCRAVIRPKLDKLRQVLADRPKR